MSITLIHMFIKISWKSVCAVMFVPSYVYVINVLQNIPHLFSLVKTLKNCEKYTKLDGQH